MRWLVFATALLPLSISAQVDEARLIAIAREAVIAEVSGKHAALTPGSLSPKPVFVTIEVAGKVVGCRGDLVARSHSLEEQIQLAARSAAAHDPRYRPLKVADLRNFQVTVTLVQSVEPISNVEGLLPDDGLILRAGTRTGIVLPWEGKDPQIRLGWAYKKAGVPVGSPAKLQRLKAIRFKG